MSALFQSRTLMTENKKDEALASARKAVELWPTASDPYLNLGLLVYSLGDKAEALTALKKAKELNPLFRGQLDATMKFFQHPGLDPDFLKQLFPE